MKSLPIRIAFARILRSSHRRFAVGLVVASAAAIGGVMLHLQRKTTIEQARVVAASFGGAFEVGSIPLAAERLRAASEPVVAIAVADMDGEIVTARPDRGEIRKAATRALAKEDFFVTRLTVNDRSVRVSAVPLAIESSGGPFWIVVMLVRPGFPWLMWSSLTALVAIFGIGAARWCSGVLLRWFDEHVLVPVDTLSRLAADRDPAGRPSKEETSDAPKSLEESSAEFQEIHRHLVEAEHRLRRIEKETEHQLRLQEAGLGERLRRAEDLATTDVLTGTRNRTYFDREFAGIIRRQIEREEELAVVMIDVDNFKNLNDTQGHPAGDELLRFLGGLLRGSIRPTDQAIRYAGDEFVLLLLNVDEEQSRTIVERIVRMFAQYALTLNATLTPSLSAGVATFRSAGTTDSCGLLAAADRALYGAKRRGKNTVVVCSAAA
jgi:diguanylate cyclase (GGDEF)-like protein